MKQNAIFVEREEKNPLIINPKIKCCGKQPIASQLSPMTPVAVNSSGKLHT